MRWGTVLVAGRSMEPSLREGDMLLIWYGASVRPGDVVVVALPARPLSVKRVVARVGAGWWLEGDNAAWSTDSRALGPIPETEVQGRVVARYWPRPRRLP